MTVSIAGVEIKSVEYGGSRQSAQVVQCGYCPTEEPIFKKSSYLPHEGISKIARSRGWQFAKNGKHACPKCLGKFKAVAMKKKAGAEDAPREMTPADKRKIFRKIDDNYDEANSRYIDAVTDNEIAKELGVPRKWVSDIREADFGPTGENEEMARVSTAIGRLAHDASEACNKAMEAAAAAEKVKLECEHLRQRLSDLEAAVGPRAVRAS